MIDKMLVRGAKVHNLKNIDVDIPLNKIVGIAGVSGSGKSSLALGVLYAEGSRRYLEALSPYTRRRMTQASKASVEEVLYVPAALALHQRPGVPGIRSTFGTGTELLNSLRLMYSRLASHRCPNGHYIPPTLAVAAGKELVCPECGAHFYAPSAEELAFNSQGACQKCSGTGSVRTVDIASLVPDDSLTIDGGAVAPWNSLMWSLMTDICRQMGVRTDVPFRDLTEKEKDIVFHGPAEKKHIFYHNKNSNQAGELDFTYFNAVYTVENALAKVKDEKGMKRVEKFLKEETCPECHGTRLSSAARAPKLRGISLDEACAMTLSDLVDWVRGVPESLPEEMRPMAESICEAFESTAKRLIDLGLGYLTLDRSASTLSTGERQRMQLARAVRNRTTGVLYVLDEPSIGLHPANITGLTGVMQDLIHDGNSVILVDHDTQILKEADWVIEMGPEAGVKGGHVIAEGTIADLEAKPESQIGPFLSGKAETKLRRCAREGEMFAEGAIHLSTGSIHTVKPLELDIPKGRLTVVTGVSGSGKSSLAFDTIYAEGQRRYMESLSSYARQFLGQMEKPDVESIEGLPPAISIDQKSTNRNPRSTVGTVTEIYDYFRLLYARVGIPHCPKCGREIKKQTVDQMVDSIMSFPERTKIQLLAPVVRGRKGTHAKLLEQAKRSGYVRVQIDGNLYELSEEISLDKNIKHNIEIVVDRLIVKPGIEKRLSDSIETVLDLAEGLLMVDTMDGNIHNFSQSFSCPDCGISVDEIEPRSFSFNNPFGACPDCLGLGYKMEFDIDLMIPDRSLSILDGAIVVTGWQSCTNEGSFSRAILDALAREYDFSLATPFEEYPEKIQDILINGTNGHSVKVYYKGQRGEGVYDVAFPGLIRNVEQRYRETGSDAMKQEYESFMRITPCKTCKGQRLKKESLAVTVADKNIYEVTNLSIEKLKAFLADMQLSEQQQLIGRQILKEIRARVSFLSDVGLDYLSLGRATGTLSGGEAQRIRLATQIGSGLVGVAYILDEPSIGLHQRDNDRLLGSLMKLRDLGNSLIVVEHDEDTMRAADCIVDIGPGAGEHGGQLVAMGTAEDLMKNEDSITGAYLSGKLKIPVPLERRKPTGFLTVKGAAENNLKNIDVKIPLGIMTCITGVSGSGKSSLINEILYKRLARDLNRARVIPGKHKDILGVDQLDKVINIDQSPIGRTPRSNPATYTGVFDQIRDLFAATADAKAKGYKKGRFSFNVKGGRCEACSGDGIIKIEMHFLPDVYVPCEVCKGKRYNRETLEVKYKDKNIYDVLNMTVEEALTFFENVPSIKRKIQTLYDVGLSYIRLGQPSTELSGGEAQRIKLATELSKRSTGKTIYILDEPTTGLHFADVHKLVEILKRLSEGGNTVVVIEHNLDVIKTADYIIDIGPEGGDQGGTVVAQGTPEEVAQSPVSYTGKYVKKYLK